MDRNKIVKQLRERRNTPIPEVTIGPNDGDNRNKEKKVEMSALAKLHHAKRSPERVRRNEMLAIQYRMEHYVQDDQITFESIYSIEDFVKDFLRVLGINKTVFAQFIEMDSANLNKYYRSHRRFNTELALKFAHFFHTPADLWLKIQIKNELLLLRKEDQSSDKYNKYDYQKLLQMT
jgi:plasmid maintenance system antidote protein VapI